jgi:hypothetical protein
VPAVGPRAAPVVREVGVSEREDCVVGFGEGSVGVVDVFEFVVGFGRFEGYCGYPSGWRWVAVVADPMGDACDCLVLLFEVRDVAFVVVAGVVGFLVADYKVLAGRSIVSFSKESEPVEIDVVWKFVAARMDEFAEEVVVVEGFCEDFGGWEEVGVCCWTGGHFGSS